MAASVSLCLGSSYVLDPLLGEKAYEKDYAEILKPLLACMCANARVSFSLYLSGEAIDWINLRHPEFFSIAAELVSKKSLEILGGGFFAPYFPLIPQADRVAQLETLSTAVRKATGKKPRGAWLPSSAWDASMVSLLSGCGMEYVLIDKEMIQHSGAQGADGSFPVSIEEGGKAITALSLECISEVPSTQGEDSIKAFCASLMARNEAKGGSGKALFIAPRALPPLLLGDEPWLSRLFDFAAENAPSLSFLTALQGARVSPLRQRRISLPSGMSPKDVRSAPEGWDARALSKMPIKHSVMNSSPFAFGLYAKMMHVHTLVSQVRGDKARKSAAREELCRAESFLHFSRETSSLSEASMAYAYKKLLSAEKLARQRGVFSDSLLSFDYDFDGKKEYLSQTTLHNMYLHTLGGRIFECAVFSAGKNFCRFSGDAEKASAEGLFIDYFLSKEEAAKTLSLPSCPLPNVFASTYYQEDFVDAARREVGLKASGLYGRFGQPVSLKKRFFFAKSGLQVQFILKNDSPMNLSGCFATALHFALSPHKKRPAEVSVFSCEERLVSVEGATEYPQAEWILISDADGGAEFKIDANENPSAIVRLSCQKGEGEGSKSAFGPSLTVFLCWQAELSPGYETEKTVFLTVMP